MNDNVVVTLDYFTLDQARKIIYAEMQKDRENRKRKAAQRRKQKVKQIKLTIALFFALVGLPLAMFVHWLVVGY